MITLMFKKTSIKNSTKSIEDSNYFHEIQYLRNYLSLNQTIFVGVIKFKENESHY